MSEKYIKVTCCGDCPSHGALADACQHIYRVPGCSYDDRCPIVNADPRKSLDALKEIIADFYKESRMCRKSEVNDMICDAAIKLARPE